MKSDKQKVLHPLCGRPMIDYVLDGVRSLGLGGIYLVLGYQSDLVRRSVGKDVIVVIQKKLRGTADAVKRATSHFIHYRGDVLILCADTPLLQKGTIQSLIKHHRATQAACTFLTATVNNPQGYGRVIRDTSHQILAIREEKDATFEERLIHEINVGVYCFQSENLFGLIKTVKLNKRKKEFYLTNMISLLVEKGERVETLMTENPHEALGVNTREDLAFAESIIRKRILRNFMHQGVTIIDPETTYIDANVKIGRDTTIRPYTVIENDVYIGRNCSIGPFCHIRPHTRLGNNIELGNFTEVSRSSVGDNTFMKHFSFLGDAVVGRRVNIGAGVVTANFDGKRKNTTHILDGASIGSDSILIAPLKIGRKAVTGAGCVVTKGKKIPDGSVVVGVPARIISRRRNP